MLGNANPPPQVEMQTPFLFKERHHNLLPGCLEKGSGRKQLHSQANSNSICSPAISLDSISATIQRLDPHTPSC